MRTTVEEDEVLTDIDSRRAASGDGDSALALERMRMALDASLTGIWDWDLVTGEVHLDERVRALWALPESAPGSFEIFRNALHPDDKERTREAVEAALDPAHVGDYEAEYRVIGQTDGIERWIAVRGRTVFENGHAARIIGTARDISDRKRREQHVHVLLRELVHRSKNLLAVVQAMARQTAAGSPSLEDFQRKFAARLQALAMAHDLLVSQEWRGACMRELASAQIGYCLDMDSVDTHIEGPRVMLKPEAAQNIGLALHELAVNALTHGALSQPGGRVELCWRREDGRFLVEWREFGGPPVADAPCEGFGHKVIKRLVAQALGGEATIGFPPDGFAWTLAVPAAQALAE
ncbi:histidine kinase [Methylosinus trichosporium OB3b]|uniref:Blue-light-activated histidine kinase n=1 Tax=Methylosinus trichosporium (strain ATCC 35070 / NCIMB 11131 / UNIQEM 75 / OB3b) TaxID=595536 RepID=A0A2D2CZG9_METT3|nr:histidine kinase [Methylosinus trichosporium OB3b]OBS54347.1 histidine kinase [Methylosinus sp. 3S-1]